MIEGSVELLPGLEPVGDPVADAALAQMAAGGRPRQRPGPDRPGSPRRAVDRAACGGPQRGAAAAPARGLRRPLRERGGGGRRARPATRSPRRRCSCGSSCGCPAVRPAGGSSSPTRSPRRSPSPGRCCHAPLPAAGRRRCAAGAVSGDHARHHHRHDAPAPRPRPSDATVAWSRRRWSQAAADGDPGRPGPAGRRRDAAGRPRRDPAGRRLRQRTPRPAADQEPGPGRRQAASSTLDDETYELARVVLDARSKPVRRRRRHRRRTANADEPSTPTDQATPVRRRHRRRRTVRQARGAGFPDPRGADARRAQGRVHIGPQLRATCRHPAEPRPAMVWHITDDQLRNRYGLAVSEHGTLHPGRRTRSSQADQSQLYVLIEDSQRRPALPRPHHADRHPRPDRSAGGARPGLLLPRLRPATRPTANATTSATGLHGGPTDIDNLTLLCGYHHREFERTGMGVRHDRRPAATGDRPPGSTPRRRPIRNSRHVALLDTG